MRLPQSDIHSLDRIVKFVTIGVAVLLLGTVPGNADASTLQLASAPSGLRFGHVVVGQTETLLATVTNTGQDSATISDISVSNPSFSASGLNLPLVLAPGQSVEVNVTFAPTSVGWVGGNIKFLSSGSGTAMVFQFEGTGVSSEAITASPSIVSFGQVPTGTSSTLPVVLTNDRPWGLSISALQMSGGAFSLTGPTLPFVLASGQSVTLNVTFTPQSTGPVGGGLFIPNSGLTIPLSGTGTTATAGQLSMAPTPLSFGNVTVGSSATQPMTLSATGGSVTISSAASSSPQFALQGISFPLTITAGGSRSFNVTFSPLASGSSSGALSIVSNASNSQATESLSGTGTVPVGQLSIAPAPLSFGSVTVGSSATQPMTLSATGGSVTISSAASSSPQFALQGISFPLTIAAGGSMSLNVTFSPQAGGPSSGALSIVSNASNSQATESLSGTGSAPAPGQLSIAPAPLSFGSVTVGSSATQPMTLSAIGGSVTISSAASSSPQFALQGASFPLTIAAGGSTSLNVTFSPQASGSSSGALSIVSNASNSQATESLSGTGSAPAPGQLSIAPAPLSFGSVTVGSNAIQPITLSATGASVTISSAASSSSQFVLDGASFPLTIAAGSSTSFNVTFTPQSGATASGALSFVSNASNSQATESLTGTGVLPTYTVDLSWNSSSGVAGYNVYRSTAANGSYAKLNSTVNPSTAFMDSSVASGQTYYYAATSVDSSGQESSRSTPVQAVVP